MVASVSSCEKDWNRNKGRDLLDLDHALTIFDGLDTARIVECSLLQMDRAKALTDETLKATFARVMKELIDRIPGDELGERRGNEGAVRSLGTVECLPRPIARSLRFAIAH